MFIWSPDWMRALAAGGDEVEGSEDGDSDQCEHEREHHGVAPFGVAGVGFSSSVVDRSARVAASLKRGHSLNSPSQVLAVVTRSIGTGFFTG
jgi:hypothetical protein